MSGQCHAMLTPPPPPMFPCCLVSLYLPLFAQTFEMAVSQFVKMVKMVLVLHTVLDVLADEEAVDEDGVELDKTTYLWTAGASAKLAQRQLAMDPDEMDTTLKSLAFTNNADTGMVQKIYRMTYEAVVTKARELFYNSMTWITKEQWAAYCSGVLPQCPHLERLDLWGNPHLEEDIVELVGKLPPTLKELNLESTGCFGDAGKADWARLPALEGVVLEDTKVTGSKEDLRAAGCAAGNIGI